MLVWLLRTNYLRLERIKNRFFFHSAYVFKTEHNRHDYYPIQLALNIPSLSSRSVSSWSGHQISYTSSKWSTWSVCQHHNFCVPSFISSHHTPFLIPSPSSLCGHKLITILFIVVGFALSILHEQLSIGFRCASITVVNIIIKHCYYIMLNVLCLIIWYP